MFGKQRRNVVARRLADGDHSERARHDELQIPTRPCPCRSRRVRPDRRGRAGVRSPAWVSRASQVRPSACHAIERGAAQEVGGLDVPDKRASAGGTEADLLRPQRARLAGLLQQIDLADEVGDEARARALVDLGRRADLLDPALVHHGDAVAHRQRLFLVVRHEHQRDAEPPLQLLQLELHLLAQLAVERAERLVAQQHARLDHQRARERHALLLAARELAGRRSSRPVSATCASAAATRRSISAFGTSRMRRPKATFSRHRAVREQRVGLEHHAHVALVHRHVGDVLAADMDAARIRASRSPRSCAGSWSCRSPTGPSSEKNSPAAMSSVTASTATTLPSNVLVTCLQFDGGGGQRLSPSGSWSRARRCRPCWRCTTSSRAGSGSRPSPAW